MDEWTCLDARFATSRKIILRAPSADGPPSASDGPPRQGGLRTRGYGKTSWLGLPLVSVITVVLDDPDALARTIRSVLEQSYDNVEYIVVDGGSGAATLDAIREHEGAIDYWRSEPDRGIYDAMNKGVARAAGEWVHFLNAGDLYYEPGTLKAVMAKNIGAADFIYGHTFFQGGDFRGVVKAWDFKILWKTMIFTHQSLLTRRRILTDRPFDTRFKICADFDLIFNSYLAGRRFLNADIVIGSFHPGLSDLSRTRMAVEKWRVVRRHRNDIPFHWFYARLIVKRFLQDLARRTARRRAQGA